MQIPTEPPDINGVMLSVFSTHISLFPVNPSLPYIKEWERVIANETINTFEVAEVAVTGDDLERRSEIFKALGDTNRLKLLYILRDRERCVSDLLPFFDILQPTVSIHLLMLQDLGLLKVRRDGRRRYYSLASDDLMMLLDRFCEQADRAIL